MFKQTLYTGCLILHVVLKYKMSKYADKAFKHTGCGRKHSIQEKAVSMYTGYPKEYKMPK